MQRTRINGDDNIKEQQAMNARPVFLLLEGGIMQATQRNVGNDTTGKCFNILQNDPKCRLSYFDPIYSEMRRILADADYTPISLPMKNWPLHSESFPSSLFLLSAFFDGGSAEVAHFVFNVLFSFSCSFSDKVFIPSVQMLSNT